MRLVVSYEYGDNYTFSATHVVPVEYESAEAFVVDFERLCKEQKYKFRDDCNEGSCFSIGGHEFNFYDFIEEIGHRGCVVVCPDVMTLDEWFEDVN